MKQTELATVQRDDFLINFGAEVKVLDESAGKIGGYCLLYGSPEQTDLIGDYFTPATDIDDYPNKLVPLLYEHGLNEHLGKAKLGRASMKTDSIGVWFESVLEIRSAYVKKIMELIKKKALGVSTGAVSHLVERVPVKNAFEIKSWFISEISLTPAPCEPRTQVLSLKSYFAELEGKRPLTPRQLQAEIAHLHARQTLREGAALTGKHPMTARERQALSVALHAQQTLRRGELILGGSHGTNR